MVPPWAAVGEDVQRRQLLPWCPRSRGHARQRRHLHRAAATLGTFAVCQRRIDGVCWEQLLVQSLPRASIRIRVLPPSSSPRAAFYIHMSNSLSLTP